MGTSRMEGAGTKKVDEPYASRGRALLGRVRALSGNYNAPAGGLNGYAFQ